MNEIVYADETPEKRERWGTTDLLLIGVGVVLIVAALVGLMWMTGPEGTAVSSDALSLLPTDDPVQSRARGAAAEPIVLDKGGDTWTIQRRSTYQIAARVLGNKSYSDWESDLVPRDLALGWGDMSDPAVDEWIHWRQSGRWYYYTWDGDSPYDGRYIKNHSANVHIIPATENLNKALRAVGENDLIFMEGFLVDIEVRRNEQMRSVQTSLTRSDSGNGACEILYVHRLVWDGKLYE